MKDKSIRTAVQIVLIMYLRRAAAVVDPELFALALTHAERHHNDPDAEVDVIAAAAELPRLFDFCAAEVERVIASQDWSTALELVDEAYAGLARDLAEHVRLDE